VKSSFQGKKRLAKVPESEDSLLEQPFGTESVIIVLTALIATVAYKKSGHV
jgi:hypothetical protein